MRKTHNINIMHEALQKAIKNLSALELMILYLKIERNYTLKEIGKKLCLSHEMVRIYLNKSYTFLKKNYENLSK